MAKAGQSARRAAPAPVSAVQAAGTSTRVVGVAVPYGRLRNWRAILQRAGVTIDTSATQTIDLIEKDAHERVTRSAKDGDDAAGGGGASAP